MNNVHIGCPDIFGAQPTLLLHVSACLRGRARIFEALADTLDKHPGVNGLLLLLHQMQGRVRLIVLERLKRFVYDFIHLIRAVGDVTVN